ncbi:hypothetical protein IFM89_025936 [Coptis chinensis]|uniref:Uncharacterized protein n=1 Tax=Coptis chinensis TaxID=261450 RepID=A0A835HNT0_9MAGN|nr:hypothetical protein IFM89_025936 [Coptis chinensis]
MNIRIRRIKLDEDGGQYCKDSSVVKKALEEAFINADTKLLNWVRTLICKIYVIVLNLLLFGLSFLLRLEETGKQTESGSTATAIFLRNDMLIVSHVLSRSGKAEVVTNPHRPYGNNKVSLQEIRIIREAGGWVCFYIPISFYLLYVYVSIGDSDASINVIRHLN